MKTRFTQAAEDRQAVIDYIIAHPNAYGPEIIAAMGWHKCVGADRLRDMSDHGELERTKAFMSIININGHKAKIHTHTYIALVTKPRSEADVVANLATNLGNKKRPDNYKTAEPTVRDPNRKPIRNQGGQGATRHEVRRGCSLS